MENTYANSIHKRREQADDTALVLRIKKGKESAFRTLFMKYGKKLYYFSRKKNLSHEDAEGVVQDVFAKIWEVRKNLDETLSINSYIITIAKHLIYNKSRKQLNRQLFEKYLAHSYELKSHNTENQIFFKELENIVLQFINELPPRAKLIFKMNRLQGMNNLEIAEQLSISKKTVENQMHAALKHIKKGLVEQAGITLLTVLAILGKIY